MPAGKRSAAHSAFSVQRLAVFKHKRQLFRHSQRNRCPHRNSQSCIKMAKLLHVALIGNPNTGKTSVFNQLTGLNQKVGNYPGITVEKKVGSCKLSDEVKAQITDLPGTYSLNATSADELIVVEMLVNEKADNFPDVAVVVADIENLKRNLLLFTQIKDLNIPAILVINMADVMERKGISLVIGFLEKALHTKVALVSARKGTGIGYLKQLILNYQQLPTEQNVDISEIDTELFEQLENTFPGENIYKRWLKITQDLSVKESEIRQDKPLEETFQKSSAELKRLQQK